MTDELELLKKDWQKKEEYFPKLSYKEIYPMIWKKSSSIVKWILIISILEFTLPHLLYLLPVTRGSFQIYEKLGLNNFFLPLTIIQYSVVCYFIYQFYKRYQEISVLDNAENLMSKIIKTRKTVKHYVIFSLSMILVTFAVFILGIYLNNDFAADYTEIIKGYENIPPDRLKKAIMWTFAIAGVVTTFVFGGIYFLLYGRLLRKLKKNHAELKKLEI